jgi:solute carrier family 13 (sodium-dependent dicarboxylate transporter), member 2/3/5
MFFKSNEHFIDDEIFPSNESHSVQMELEVQEIPQFNFKKEILHFLSVIIGPILSIPFMFDILEIGNTKVSRVAGVTIITASWWMFETFPVAITSLTPVIFFPLFKVMPASTISEAYFNDLVFLFISSYMLAIALEEWNLHKRFAFRVLQLTCNQPILILGGFMLISFTLSMWLNNTSTTALLIPMANAIVSQFDKSTEGLRFSKAIMLAIPYSASIGGISTLTGTATNLVLKSQMDYLFPKYGGLTFFNWMFFAVPLTVFFLILVYIYFIIFFIRGFQIKNNSTFIREELKKLGNMKYEEIVIAILFLFQILLWMLRKLPVEGYGWGYWFDSFPSDATSSCFVSLLMFMIPSFSKPGKKILTWERVNAKLPWNIVLLLGSSFAFAKAFEFSGFSKFVTSKLVDAENLPLVVLLLLICFVLSFLTELMSNLAIATIVLPIMASLALEISQNPLIFMIPCTIVCSLAFMSPIGTPPNSIGF